MRGSGSGREKGDVNTRHFKVECKGTKHGSMQVQLPWLVKIEEEAFDSGRRMALELSFLEGKKKFVLISQEDFDFFDTILSDYE